MDFPRGRRSAPIRRWGERPSGRAYAEPSSWPAGNGQAGKPLRPRRSSTAGPSGRPVERKFKGHEAGKPIRGRKRRILTEAGGRLRAVEVRDADLHQDRDGAKGVLKRSRRRFPFVARLGRRRPPPASRFPGLRRPLSSSMILRAWPGRKASSSSAGAGSWSAPWPGSRSADASAGPRSNAPAPPERSSQPPQAALVGRWHGPFRMRSGRPLETRVPKGVRGGFTYLSGR